jgi:uncharacterized protein (DUF697 family)
MSDVTTATPESNVEVSALPAEDRLAAADRIVRSHVKWAAAGGLVPLPGLDMAAVAGVQLRMLDQLSRVYGVAFRENLTKEIIGTLIGSGIPFSLAASTAVTFGAFIRLVPVVGQLFGLAIFPAFAAASTFALGRVFTKHFESGGTFLDFDLKKGKAEYNAELEKAKDEAKAVAAEATGRTSTPSAKGRAATA